MGRFDDLDRLAITTLRALAIDAIEAANSGHPGAPLGLSPLGWLIFRHLRKHDPADPAWPDRDRFVLSAGHASMLNYGLLHLSGYDLPLEEIRNFRQWGSLTPGHPEVDHTPGVEITTGPLGQGLSTAVGMAMAERQLALRFNREGKTVIDHLTWVIASDGDLMEGVASEAASLAGHLQLGKLIAFWDDNSITIDGRTDITFTEDVERRFEAYGWHVQRVSDGEDLEALFEAAERAKADPRPSLIAVKTVIGYPAPKKQNTSGVHGSPLGAEEAKATKAAMGWEHGAFHVPAEVAAIADAIRAKGAEASAAWRERHAAWGEAEPEARAELERRLAGELPAGLEAAIPVFPADPKGMATRKASGAVLGHLAGVMPELVGGSADLAASNNTYLKGEGDFAARMERAPRNVHWGIREHAMAAACNGLSLHGGVRPYCATFLVFADYMRGAIRLGSLMRQPTIYVFTHDSIGLGEDGPTHQPVEHLASLRAIPGLTVIRPADANETREAWLAALASEGPVALALTRQNLPTLDRAAGLGDPAGTARGAYVLSEREGAKATLLATGSEVPLALEVQDRLAGEGVATRVVSFPSWELFAEQPADYQAEVLGAEGGLRVVLEAGIRQGWERWAGSNAAYVTLEHFGASAPAERLFEEFGFSVEKVAAVVKGRL
ncbi:MAG: transketolase [Deltaproteobacteria bacterium]|nr:transketolase [Deltaproteobacteria bacterium]